MIIVSGRIHVTASERDAFLTASLEAIALARNAQGCLDFVVAADPIEPDRVNVYEEWTTEADLEAFRGAGPGDEQTSSVVHAEVLRHQVSSSGPA